MLCEPYPFFRIQVQIFDFPMLEETRQADTIIRKMRLLSNDNDVVLSPLDV